MKNKKYIWPGKLKLTLLLAMSVGLSACIEERVIVKVDKNGAGYVEHFSYNSVENSMETMFSGMTESTEQDNSPADSPQEKFNDEYFENFARSMGEGVSVKDYTLGKNDAGMEGYHATYAFNDISTISVKTRDADGSDEEDLSKKKNSLTGEPSFSMNDGILTIKIPHEEESPATDGAGQNQSENMPPQMLKMMAAMFDGMRIAVSVEAINGIKETNALLQNGDSITLTDIRMSELFNDENALNSLQNVESMSRAEIQAFADKTKGFDIDIQEEIVIKLK